MNLRDDREGAGGEGIFVRVDIRNTEIEEQVDKQRSHVLSQKHLPVETEHGLTLRKEHSN